MLRKPEWLRVRLPAGDAWKHVSGVLEKHRLHTVCDEAHCPNKGECWGLGTATFMLMGDVCTRGCRFCAVSTGKKGLALRSDEGDAIARAAEELKLRYLVLTSVDRDDLADRGAGHFAACIRAIKERLPAIKVEALTPDYTEREFAPIAAAGLEVAAHNLETVRSLQTVRDSRASFDKSLATLRAAKALGVAKTKSSLILGLGETRDEVLAAMDELRCVNVDILVLGQYLQPTLKQLPVKEYITPQQFADYAAAGRQRGFSSVVSAPLARTSYHALDTFEQQQDETNEN